MKTTPPPGAWFTIPGDIDHQWATDGACLIRDDCPIPDDDLFAGRDDKQPRPMKWRLGDDRPSPMDIRRMMDATKTWSKKPVKLHPRFAPIVNAGKARAMGDRFHPVIVERDGKPIAYISPMNVTANMGGYAGLKFIEVGP